MQRLIRFNAWLPELGYMLEDVAYGHGQIGFPSEDKEFEKALVAKGFAPDECELPEWLYDTGEDWYYITDPSKYVLLQYIGVKGYEGDYESRHANEVELYEGDIIEAMSQGYKGTFQIKFRQQGQPMWLLFPNYQNREYWKIHASDTGREPGDYYDDLKRIGNIYQNPELLTITN